MNKRNIVYIIVIGVCFITIVTIVKNSFLFAFYLFLNLSDYITGSINARIHKKESSKKGDNGIIKKIGYWILILISFALPAIFIQLGKIIKIDFQITTLFSWFILCSLMINECRSIIENLTSMGCTVPKILIEGLEIIDKKINKGEEKWN